MIIPFSVENASDGRPWIFQFLTTVGLDRNTAKLNPGVQWISEARTWAENTDRKRERNHIYSLWISVKAVEVSCQSGALFWPLSSRCRAASLCNWTGRAPCRTRRTKRAGSLQQGMPCFSQDPAAHPLIMIMSSPVSECWFITNSLKVAPKPDSKLKRLG